MIETDTNDWDHLPTGEIEISPVVNWAAAAATGCVMLRLEILTDEGQIGWAQLGIPSAEAADLAKAMAFLALRAGGIDQQGHT